MSSGSVGALLAALRNSGATFDSSTIRFTLRLVGETRPSRVRRRLLKAISRLGEQGSNLFARVGVG
jgi:hypothetical protein